MEDRRSAGRELNPEKHSVARLADRRRHSAAEDAHALLIGAGFTAFGLVLLKADGLVTGGVAGVALIASYATGWPVGGLFIAINLPFFLLAQRQLGAIFTAKSIAVMAAVAVFTSLIPQWLRIGGVTPLFAAPFGGSLIGMGVLSLARHRASVGGIGVVALYLQEKRGISAGLVQLISDVVILAAAGPVIGTGRLCYSILSAVAVSVVMVAYHRPGRYTGY